MCFGSVHSPLWFVFGRVLRVAELLTLTRLAGLGVSFIMVGNQPFLVLGGAALGRTMLLILPKTSWRLHLVLMLMPTVSLLRVSIWMEVTVTLLLALLFGLMVAWFLTRSLRLGLPGQVFMLISLVNPGSIGGGVILICYLLCLMEGVRHVDYSALSRAPCSRFNVLKSRGKEGWGVWLHSKVAPPCILGVDNLNVVNNVSSLIAHRWAGRPFPLVNDGDLLLLVQRMVRGRGRGNTLVTKVKGLADEG